MLGKFGVMVALLLVIFDKIWKSKTFVQRCPCTKSILEEGIASSCDLALQRALGDLRITECKGGYHYRLDAEDKIMPLSQCPCSVGFIEKLIATRLRTLCLVDQQCLILALYYITLFVFVIIVLAAPLNSARIIIIVFSFAHVNYRGEPTWIYSYVTVAAIFFTYLSDGTFDIMVNFGHRLSALHPRTAPGENLIGKAFTGNQTSDGELTVNNRKARGNSGRFTSNAITAN